MANKKLDKEHTRHPAFGVINISRVSGMTHLFGSSFNHHNFISLTISTASEYGRFGVSKSVMSEEQIVEVSISESQFGQMISSLNMGCGTPCTLEYVQTPDSLKEYAGKRIPNLEPEDIRKTHKDGLEELISERLEALGVIERRIDAWRSDKHRPTLRELEELRKEIHQLHLANSLAYCQEVLEEKMEETLEEGRTEIEAHADLIMRKLGLDAIHKQSLPEVQYGQRLEATPEHLAGSED